MIGNRGIDQDVQSTVDAYRGNPNALAQKYQQNQQLIDLLALQKLKSEKESVARDMQLKMGGQQMPTVAEKLEGEVLDLTKNEIAQQSTGAMQQQAQQKQQAMKGLVDQQTQPAPSGPLTMGGVAGLPAPNMAPKAMAAGGIVAFEEGGMAEDEMSPEARAEMERFIASQQPQAPQAPRAPRQSDMSGLARQGIRNLIGTRTPDETFQQRRDEGTRAADYSPEERAIMQKQLADRSRFDAERYSPQQQQNEALTRFLLGGAGRSGIGSIMAGGTAASENYKASMRDADRARLMDRQKQESDVVDVGPAARQAGMKLGSEGERTAMTGLAQGTGDAVRLMQMSERAAAAGNPAEAKKLAGAARQINSDTFLREGSKLLSKLVQENRTDDPLYNQTLRDLESRQNQIYKLWGIEMPEIPMPSQSAAPSEPAAEPGIFSKGFDAFRNAIGGRPSSGQPVAPKAPAGKVDTSNPLLR